MYIDGIGAKGLSHLIYEIVDNAVDEHLVGYRDEIQVVSGADGPCMTKDNGHGTPVEVYRKGASVACIVLSTLRTGGKFDSGSYKTNGGLRGIGSSVVNVLSEYTDMKMHENGYIHHDKYKRGIPIAVLKDGLLPALGETKKIGTEINFPSDGNIFERARFKAERLRSQLYETAYLNPKLVINYRNRGSGEERTIIYSEPEGIVTCVKELSVGKTSIHDPVYLKEEVDRIEAEVALQFVDTLEESILSFCDNIFTQEDGTHLVGFKTKFMTLINSYARELGILKEKDANSTGVNTRNRMMAIMTIKHPDPIFKRQTRTKMASADATKTVFTTSGDGLQRYFDRNLEVLEGIIICAEKSTRIREAEGKAKTNMPIKSKLSFNSNGELANCESRDAEKCEILIVEGDSTGGSAETARNRMYQATLSVRGRILNVGKVFIDKVLANARIKTMISTFGCGFSGGYGNDFGITKLRYHKIALMTDADMDDSHIDTLFLTFLYRFMSGLTFNGHVYIVILPLFKVIPRKGEEQYLYDEREPERYWKTHTGKFTLQRHKGLGEMDAQQLWEMTLDPESRVLERAEIEDTRLASEMTEMLMGSEVSPRRQSIYERAGEAEIDA